MVKLLKYLVILIAVIIGVTTACCHVQFDTLGYDILLTVRWNKDLKIGLTYKDSFSYKVLGTENLIGNSASRVEKQLAGY
jgi:hypothetical protein